MSALLTHIKTNPAYVVYEIRISYKGVRVRVGLNTGNWYPDGKPWLASIGADIHHYEDQTQWVFGLGAWGSSRDEAIKNAIEYAKSCTVRLPDGWYDAVKTAIDNEYQVAQKPGYPVHFE